MTKILATRKKVLKLTTSQSLLEVSSLSMGHPQTPFKAVKPDIKHPKLCVLLTKMFFLIWTAEELMKTYGVVGGRPCQGRGRVVGG